MMRTCFIFIFFAFTVSSCSTCGLREKANNALDSALAEVREQLRQDSIDNARKQQLRFEIDSILAADYIIDPHGMSPRLYMHHKWNNTLDRGHEGIAAVVREDGSIALVSTLPQQQHSHNRLELTFKDTTIEIGPASTYTATQPGNDGLIMIPQAKGDIVFIEEPTSAEVAEYIAAHPEEEITVRAYFNEDQYSTYTLSETDKEMILKAHELTKRMKELNELEAADVEFDD